MTAAPDSRKVIFENALVRVLEVTMPPTGKTEPMHHHHWPGFFLDWDTGGKSPHNRYHQPGNIVRDVPSTASPVHPGHWSVHWMKPEPMHAIETVENYYSPNDPPSVRVEIKCGLEHAEEPTVVSLRHGRSTKRKAVQLANFGRELTGFADSLRGYPTSLIAIRDPAVVTASGKTHHTIADPSVNLTDEVRGTVYQITSQELAAADRYEVSEYTRILVTLKSGKRAWVYVRA